VSQAVLQNKPDAPGSLSRVPAAELEALVVAALHKHLAANGARQKMPDVINTLLSAISSASSWQPRRSKFVCGRWSVLRKMLRINEITSCLTQIVTDQPVY